VNYRLPAQKVPQYIRCPFCNAPHIYIYRNNGTKKSQFKCKVCKRVFQSERHESKSKYFCPYCNYALYKWKENKELTIYKCPNDNCHKYQKELKKLNAKERKLIQTHGSQFKLRYQYREYHYELAELDHSSPKTPKIDIKKIYNSKNILGLILAFYVSFAVSARKTAAILKSIFKINISYQTVLNYAEASAYYAHKVNMKYKGVSDNVQAGDETYIKIKGKDNFVFFFISALKRNITSYHIDNNRATLPAVKAMMEAKRTVKENEKVTFITDGNPSYPAGIHFINALSDNDKSNITHHKVIGLQNLDSESEQYRPFKQIIERLNRTYKQHVRPSHGFNSANGAVSLTTLFVTHYNFLRPHSSLNFRVPVPLRVLNDVEDLQTKWIKLLSMAYT
jgi:transposase-like protein